MEPHRPRLAGWRRPLLAWTETAVLTGLAIGLSLWLRPSDPLFAGASYPWPAIAPLLAALRYGFAHGLVSGVTLAAVAESQIFLAATSDPTPVLLPTVGMLVVALVAGEFRDAWDRRLQRLERIAEYSEARLGEFTRAHHLLRLSHDQLEQRLASTSRSLRTALLDLRARFGQAVQANARGDGFAGCGERILELLGEYGNLATGSLHPVDPATGALGSPAASLGSMPALDASDALVTRALARGELVSVSNFDSDPGEASETTLIAAIPLTTADDRVLGIVAVHYMPFFALTSANLTLLAVLAGNIADTVDQAHTAPLDDAYAQGFQRELRRTYGDARRYGFAAVLVVYHFPSSQLGHEFANQHEERRRGLDLLWYMDDDARPRLLVLLPLTDGAGFVGYRERVESMAHQCFGAGPDELGVSWTHLVLERRLPPAQLRQFLTDNVGLDAKHVAV